MMIKLFSTTDTAFSTNGDAVIVATKARVFNADNGDYYLELTCGTEYTDYIQPNNILVVPTPQGEQGFRIRTVTKSKKKLEVKAWHLFYDSDNYLIADSYAVNKTCAQALNYFNDATDNPSPYTMYSDIMTLDTYRCVRTSLHECINVILERWGGHLIRNNWTVSILSNIGTDNGITLEYRKNIKELTAEYDFSNVCTKLLPVGKDGQLIDGLYLYSDIQYPIPFTKSVNFEQNIEREDYPSEQAYINALKQDLINQGTEYLEKNSLPNINYTLKGNPEKVSDIGDIIEVRDERIGVDVLTSVISYEYDAIQEKYIELEFGNFTPSLGGLMGEIANTTSTAVAGATAGLTTEINQVATTVTSLSETITDLQTNKQDKLTAGAHMALVNNNISCTIGAGNGLIYDNQGDLELDIMRNYTFSAMLPVFVLGGELKILGELSRPIGSIYLRNFNITLYTQWGNAAAYVSLSNTDSGIMSSIRSTTTYGFELLITDSRLNNLEGAMIAEVSFTCAYN